MPIENYLGGKGKDVMSKMKTEYGDDKGKQVFYATLNKRKGKGLASGIKNGK